MSGILSTNDYYRLLDDVKTLRKKGQLHVKFRSIDISRVLPDRKARESYIAKVFSVPMLPLAQLLHLHYQKHSISYWNAFLDNWLNKCDKVIVAYATVPRHFVCGICLLIEGPYLEEDDMTKRGHVKDIYVRLLCSNSHCGSLLLQHIQDTYKGSSFERFKLYSEPNRHVIDFYTRNGFYMLSEVMYDTHSTPYPAMIYTLGNAEDKTVEKPIVRPTEVLLTPSQFVNHYNIERCIASMYANIRWHMSKWLGY